MKYDFSGYATRNDLRCSDGRTIKAGAFAHQDQMKVPLVWMHQKNEPGNVLGYAILEHRADGVYCYAVFNDSEPAQDTKALIEHGDIDKLSIHANQLQQRGMDVYHGNITEVSVVVAGANPGATIDNVILAHSDGFTTLEDEAIIFTEDEYVIEHRDGGEITLGEKMGNKNVQKLGLQHAATAEAETEESIADIFETLSPKQLAAVEYALEAALTDDEEEVVVAPAAAAASADAEHSASGSAAGDIQHNQEGTIVTRVFEQNGPQLEHGAAPRLTADQLKEIMHSATKNGGGSYKEAFLQHVQEYGIPNIDLMFPDAKLIESQPEWVKRRTEWVSKVLDGTKKLPYARVKTMFADITHDEARAKGYIKATLKKEEFFSLTKRVTTPQTIYKKQKLDRDDMIDVTDLDVVAWLKGEMRLMLEEEIARAILIGDGREVDDDDKIKDPASNSDGAGIRSIAHDHEFYAHPLTLATNASAKDITSAIVRGMENYRGSGNPTMFALRGFTTDLLLQEDKMGRRLYRNRSELADDLEVSSIVDVEVLSNEPNILAIIVNLSDYAVGTDRGGETTFFDDFDIDYNQYKYLYETRMSGGLTKWKSAIVVKRSAGTSATPTVPGFVASTGVVTIPTVTGVQYYNADTNTLLTSGAQTAIPSLTSVEIEARPAAGYYFPFNFDADWEFTRTT